MSTAEYTVNVDNPIVSSLPNHLKQFIVDQKYDSYTPVDHAVWRYVMRQNYHFLKVRAHDAYISGLKQTGIDVEKIPSIEQMNEILSSIGWAAVTVDGFIPPAAFMEFQAHNVLVIAADIRQINHIEYTPAPDIIHEAAGHAPIIADAEYAEYLRRFGEVGSKAMSSKKDFELYEAIRHLSILKEQPDVDTEEILRAEQDVEYKQAHLGKPSEMALLSRLHWWTVEYGLIGDVQNPKIYGAGLLSSIGESASCLTDTVKKIPYGLEASDYAFDITTKQPQLFVTPSFSYLIDVLEEFAQTLAYRVGGREGILKAIECENVCTYVYSSGIQISGIVSSFVTDDFGNPVYIRTTGPTMLSYENTMIPGHDKKYHAEGFGSPVGKLAGEHIPLEKMNDSQLKDVGIEIGSRSQLVFESGITVHGILENISRFDGRIILMSFSDCRVLRGGDIFFQPEWGMYDMAVGEQIVSVFNGAADKDAYEQTALVPHERTVKTSFDDRTLQLHDMYQTVRNTRNNGGDVSSLQEIWKQVQDQYPHEWLLPLEILELLVQNGIDEDIQREITSYLQEKARTQKELSKLITDGLALVG